MEHLRGAGGVTKIIMQPFQTKDLFYIMIDALSTQKKVEDTFKSLTRKKIISSKYPYMPIFDKSALEEAENEEKGRSMDRTSRRQTRITEIGSLRSGVSVSGEQKVEEVEDATDCSSLLPDYVKRIRAESPELNSPYRQHRMRADTEEGDLEEDRLHAEAAEREAWRAKQNAKANSMQQDDLSLESSVQNDRPGDFIVAGEANPFTDVK